MSWKLYQIDGFLMSLGSNKSITDPNLYYYIVGDESLILMTYSGSVLLDTRKPQPLISR
jgi:hypothetical protein